MSLALVDFIEYDISVKEALDRIDARTVLAGQSRILIKPNLVNSSPFPITTSVHFCKSVLEYIRSCCSQAEIVIGEGSGDTALETDEIFDLLGYKKLAIEFDIQLVDLNYAPLKTLTNNHCSVFPEMILPEIAFTHFIVSLPVLKAHSLSTITGTLKNMMGFAPPQYYSGKHGIWKKAVFHDRIHESIADLNKYLLPNLTVMDASVGLADYHLGGPTCKPPVSKILAGFDAFEVDRKASDLLGFDWKGIPHLIE